MDTTIDPRAGADSMAAFKLASAAEPKQPATIEPTQETSPAAATEPPASDIATAAEPVEPAHQEKPDPKEKSLADLRRLHKAATDRADKAERELQELRNGTRKPAEETAPPPAATASKRARIDYSKDPDYPQDDGSFDTMADLLEARAEFRAIKVIEAREAKQASDKAADTAKEREESVRKTVTERLSKATEEFPDYAEKIEAAKDWKINDGIAAALNDSERTVALRYHLATNPDVYERINAMEPRRAYGEMFRLEALITATPAGTPDKPTAPAPVPVRRAPPPHPIVGGTAPAGMDLDLSKARNMKEYKEIEFKIAASKQRKAG